MKPTIGRIVHFYEADGEQLLARAAIVTDVDSNGRPSLLVFRPGDSSYHVAKVHETSEPALERWAWPPRA